MMGEKTATETDETKTPPPPEPTADETKSATLADVKRVVTEALEPIKALLPTGKGTETETETETEDKAPPVGGVRRRMEAEAQRMVREAAEALKEEEDHRSAHEKIAEDIKAKSTTEDNPIKVPFLRRIMWGDSA